VGESRDEGLTTDLAGASMKSERMTWAAVTRNDETLLVSYTIWSDALLQAAGNWPEDPVMDEITGTWRVPSASVTPFVRAIQAIPSSDFERTFSQGDVSPWVAPTVTAAISPGAAMEAKTGLIHFLERGAFVWRFVSRDVAVTKRPEVGR
jgi:hypothetical protein